MKVALRLTVMVSCPRRAASSRSALAIIFWICGVAFKRGNACRRCTVGSGARRDHESVALNGSRRRDCLIGARVGQFEHHQVVDGHRVIDIHQVPLLRMRVCGSGNGSIGLDESGPEPGQVSGTPVPHDGFELARVGKLGATHIDAVQSVERARELERSVAARALESG